MNERRQQSGFAILLMLIGLLGMGISGMSHVAGLYKSTGSGFTTDQYALQTARQSLLSYAALYPFHYGPRGAGPGHLPCPDTDGVMAPQLRLSMGMDGPNPPCGSGPFVEGKLPRHVNLPGHRYTFHTEPSQRLDYRVSSGLINNPVNRLVNDAILDKEQGESAYLAWIGQPSAEHEQSMTMLSQTVITRQSLLPGVRQAVSAWFLWQVNHQAEDDCLPAKELRTQLGWPDNLGLLSLIAKRVSASADRQASESGDEQSDDCAEDLLTNLARNEWLLENVVLASHWFVRNRWQERIVIRASQACLAEASGSCHLVNDPQTYAQGQSDSRLHFIWQVIL